MGEFEGREYFYLKEAGHVALLDGNGDDELTIPGLDDERVVKGSVREFTRYSGWVNIKEEAGQVPA